VRERRRKTLKMPEVLGLTERDAQVMLANHGFREARVRYVRSYDTIGEVVGQAPMHGQIVDANIEVELRIAQRSFVRFLPQIYQQDDALGHHFLREYLWVFQHLFASITDNLDEGYTYYDARETPEEFLPWLASWVSLTLDVDWEESKKRKLIRSAAENYRRRGTRRAIEDVLHIFLDKKVHVEENAWPYPGFCIGVTSSIGEDSIVLPKINLDHCFMVHIPIAPDEITEEMVVKVHNIINLEKPAHTMYFLQFQLLEKRAAPQVFMQIGVSSLGVPDLRYDRGLSE
jgi:phage tail-like protein